MEKAITKMNYEELQLDLAKHAQKGYPMFLAGIIFWLVTLISSFILELEVLVWVYIFGVGLVFPLGILLAKLLSVNFLASHNPLSAIGGLVGGIQIFFAPIVILLAFNKPEWIPFVLGVLTGAHFLPYVAIYKSKTYLFQTIATVLTSSVIGQYWMEQAFVLIPAFFIIIYLITLFLLKVEMRKIAKVTIMINAKTTS
ncbi:hypothetical protein FZW96_19565 [Bacillus sp. BGMRC 2118]|nr:hypothetical protein FZW96_19565 [Bacillus sp. BGMRC 2118]